jgi:purine-binding chemotaxis protein CheW
MSGVHVRVTVGGETYAFPVEDILEVAEVGDLASVPGAGLAVLGVRNLHGQVLPVFDLAHVLATTHQGRATRIVVAEHGGRRAGLTVDEVTDVALLTAELEPTEAAFLSRAGLESGCLVGVIDIDQVFEALGRQTA